MLVKIELGGGRQRAVPIPSYKNAEYFFFFLGFLESNGVLENFTIFRKCCSF